MVMGKYSDDAKKLLDYVGGKQNITAVTHCMTRMRFVLADPEKADVAKIEALKSVKGTFTQAGQFQVIIGNDVSVFYNEFTSVSGIEGVSKEEVKQEAKGNMNPVQKAVANIAEIFAPLIPAIIVGGLILGFRNIIGEIRFMNGGTETLIEVSQFWAGVHSFLWLIGEAIFHFLPVGITWSVTKKMGTTQILGIVLGLTLVSPQLLNAYAMAPGVEVPVWDFGFFTMQMVGYQAQVIPAILAGFVLVYLEKFFKKITPGDFHDRGAVLISGSGCDRGSRSFGTCGLGCGLLGIQGGLRGTYLKLPLVICNRIRFYLRTACDHRPSSHDQCHRFAADGGIWRHDAVADDRFIQYRTGIRSTGYDLFAEA